MNDKQLHALELVKQGVNVFITGSAGVGKSYCIERIVDYLESTGKKFAVTATTGCAAIQICATTLHSWAGIGLGSKNSKADIRKIIARDKLDSWKCINTLIIDEVSMLDHNYFKKLNGIAKEIRNNKKPFGGIQLIFVGDFCQLGPINTGFIFEQESLWGELNLKTIELTDIMRQKEDDFVKILQKLRLGACSDKDRDILTAKKKNNSGGVLPTKIRSTNKQVDFINKRELGKMAKNNKIHEYRAMYSGADSKYHFTDITPDVVEICVGCQVMVTYNVDIARGIVNGTRGVVTECSNDIVKIKLVNGEVYPIGKVRLTVEDHDGKIHTKSQISLRLAYAISIHKCQGMTIDYMEVDLGSSIFCHGQTYTAVSRARTMGGLIITNFDTRKIICDEKVIDFYKKNVANS